MTVVVSRGFAWIAERDRVAHAHIARGRHTRTLCGLPALDPRYAMPAAVRCARCEEVASGRHVTSITTCPLCQQGIGGRHPDHGGTHPGRPA